MDQNHILRKIFFYSTRILGVLFALFLGLFALDTPFGIGFIIHLIPALIVLAFTVFAWFYPITGGYAIILLGFLSLIFFNTYRSIPTMIFITLPFIVIGGLHLLEVKTR